MFWTPIKNKQPKLFSSYTGGWGQFLKQQDIETEQFTSIGDDELLLGASSLDYEDAVTIPFNKKQRITLLLQGDNSSGKSKLAQFLVYGQLNGRFKRPVLSCDAKLDSHTLIRKNTNQAHKRILKLFGIEPEKWDCAKYISPETLDVSGAWAKNKGGLFRISLKNLNDIKNPTVKLSLVWKLFNTEFGEPAARELQKIFLNEHPPMSMTELSKAIHSIEPKPPPTLLTQFDLLKDNKTLGDTGLNFPKLLMENELLILEMIISSAKENNIQDIFVNMVIMSCIQDRKLSVDTENKQGYINRPFTVFIEEGNVFCGKGKETAELADMITSKFRQFNPEKASKGIETYGCDSVIVSQHIHELSPILVKESDWVLMPKLTDMRDGEILKERNLDSVDLQELQSLDYPTTRPVEWSAIGKNKEIFHFWPLPTQNTM